MDFAVCPACRQSVLDDDADVCPFCGASMKSKPGSQPVAPAAKAAPPAKKAPSKKEVASDDLPFAIESSAGSSAVQAARQPTKGRGYKVICPMCETEGYVPSSAAGKQVKCANPQCLVPLFTAPVPKEEPVVKKPEKSSSGNLVVLGLVTTVVVSGIGAGVWFWAQQPGGDDVFVKPVDLSQLTGKSSPPKEAAAPATTTTTPLTTPVPGEVGSSTPPPAANFDPSATIAAALQESQQASLLGENRNRSKPLCRRWAAEAFARAGKVEGARQQIDALSKVGPQLPFYQVTPWLEVFWQEHRQGKTAAAATALDQALAKAETLPERGRDQLDVASQLAHALVVQGQDGTARQVVQTHQTTQLDGEVSAQFMWIAMSPELTDVKWLFETQPVVIRDAPQAAAVASMAVLSGHRDRGLQFAKSWPDLSSKTDALTGWAEAATWKDGPEAITAIAPVLEELPAASRALILARVARIAHVGQAAETEKGALEQARAALAELQAPENVTIPGTEALVKTRPVFPAELAKNAAAAAELAIAELEVGGAQGAAEATLNQAIQFTRGLGPALSPIQRLIARADQIGPAALRQELKTELSLRTDDEARQMLGVYRRALTDLETGAKTRLALQTQILTRATQQGLAEAVWKIVAQGIAQEDDALREDFLNSEVAIWLQEKLHQEGKSADEQALIAARKAAGLPALSRPAAAIYWELLDKQEYSAAAKLLQSNDVQSDLKEALLLQAAVTRAAQDRPLAEAWSVVNGLTDVALKEQAVFWVAWMGSRRGNGGQAWSHIRALTTATEIVAVARGVVFGITDHRARSATEAAPPAAKDASK